MAASASLCTPSTGTRHFTWVLVATFLCYLAMVMPLSSLAIHITVAWGMSNFMAGVVTGTSFVAMLVCRKPCGDIVDRKGGKYCFLRGSLGYVAGCCVCLAAAVDALPVTARFAALLLGRIIIGVSESMCNVGINHWSIQLMGLGKTGRTMANIGMSMYSAVGLGGQLGYYLYEKGGFFWLMAVCTLAPLLASFIIGRLPAPEAQPAMGEKCTLLGTMRRVMRFGLPALLHSVGFGVLAAFLSKTFLDRGWPHAGLGLTLWGAGFVCMRLVLGHLPDKKGGYAVAAQSGAVAVAGLYILYFMPSPEVALAGCFLTGAGTSMVLPSLMMENIRAAPAKIRGAAIGCYNIYVDLAYAFTGPVTGLFTDRFGDGAAYLIAALAASAGLFIVVRDGRAKRMNGGAAGSPPG